MYVGAYDGFKADMWSLGAVILDVYCGFVSASRLEASAIPFDEPNTTTRPRGQAVPNGANAGAGGEERFDKKGSPFQSRTEDGSSAPTTPGAGAKGGGTLDAAGSSSASCIGDFYVVVQGGFSSPHQSPSKVRLAWIDSG